MPHASADSPARMPVLFLGHGSPMNAIEDNEWSRAFRALGPSLPRPKAILSVSAHWYVPGTMLTGEERPRTIHDFGGFPDELYRMRYPAPGDPALAGRARMLVGEVRASVSTCWGLDHGTWSVLHHLFPDADVPVVQLSIDQDLPPAGHLDLGKRIAPLRDEGVLVMGSGNLTHNLRHAMSSGRRGESATPEWALRFDREAADAALRHDEDFFVHALESADGRMCHPTPDHYLPVLYAIGASDAGDPVRFPIEGFSLSSLSMRAMLLG